MSSLAEDNDQHGLVPEGEANLASLPNDHPPHADEQASLGGSEPSKEAHKKRMKQATVDTIVDDDVDSFFEGSNPEAAPAAEVDDDKQTENLSCGRGIKKDWNSTVRKYWREEMTNFNQKTVAVTL